EIKCVIKCPTKFPIKFATKFPTKCAIKTLLGITTIAGIAAAGAGTNSITLEEAVRAALESNPELRASGARVDAAAGRAYQAKKWTNPELELNAEDWPVSNGRGFSDAKQTIGIAQTLPYPGKKSLDKRIGGERIKICQA